MNKQAFDEAIGEAPQSTIDVDAVITRGRRAARIRRVANPVVAAGVAVAVVSGAIAFTMMGDGGEQTRVGAPPTTTATTQPPDATGSATKPPQTSSSEGTATSVPEPKAPEACDSPDVETPVEAAGRLTQSAATAVAAQRPDLRLTPNSQGQGGVLQFHPEKAEDGTDRPLCDKFGGMVAMATTEGPEGKGNIVISMATNYYERSWTCAEQAPPGTTYCEEQAGPNGMAIVKYTTVQENGITSKLVDVLRPEGVMIHLQAENVATSVKTGDDPNSAIVPLTHEQMVTIGTDPGMTLFP